MMWKVKCASADEGQDAMDGGTDEDAAEGGEENAQKRPFQGLCFLQEGLAGRGTGEMKEGEKHGGKCGLPSPAVFHKEGVDCGKFPCFSEDSGGGIAHKDDGEDDFIGRKTQQEAHEDGAVESETAGEGVKEVGNVEDEAGTVHVEISQNPQQHPSRGGSKACPAEDEDGAVEEGTDENAAELGFAVGRQFEEESGLLAAEEGFGEEEGDGKGHPDGEEEEGKEEDGTEEGVKEWIFHSEKEGNQGDEEGESAVAGDEHVGDGGDEAFLGGLDDAASGDAGGVAAEAHAHGECLFSTCSGTAEGFIEVEGDAWEESHVLQNGEEGEENRHGGQHDGDDPREDAVHPLHEQAVDPSGGMAGGKGVGEAVTEPEEGDGEGVGEKIRPDDGNPEEEGKQQQHEGDGEFPLEEDAVEDFIPTAVAMPLLADDTGDVCGVVGDGSDDGVGTQFGGDAGCVEGFQLAADVVHMVGCAKAEEFFGDGGVLLKKTHGSPAWGNALIHALKVGQDGSQKGVRGLTIGQGRRGLWGHPEGICQLVQQLVDAPAGSGGDADDGDAQQVLKGIEIDRNALFSGFIEEIDADDDTAGQFHALQGKGEVAFETAGITDDDDGVRLLETEVVPCGFLLSSTTSEGVAAGEIDEKIGISPIMDGADGVRDSLPCPVAGVLVEAGEGVEEGGLADIGIAGKGNDRQCRMCEWMFHAIAPFRCCMVCRRRFVRCMDLHHCGICAIMEDGGDVHDRGFDRNNSPHTVAGRLFSGTGGACLRGN